MIALSDQGLAQRTVDLYRSAMRQIMRRAVGRVIPTNPVEQVELAAVGRKAEQRRALTAEEQQWIWNTPHRAQPGAVIMMLSGLRRGELAALTWNDVDLKARTITVNKTIEYDSNGTPTLRHVTKSDDGMRTVDIPQRLADYMAAMTRDGLLVIDPQSQSRGHDCNCVGEAVALLYAGAEYQIRHQDAGRFGAHEIQQARSKGL